MNEPSGEYDAEEDEHGEWERVMLVRNDLPTAEELADIDDNGIDMKSSDTRGGHWDGCSEKRNNQDNKQWDNMK